jgi:hypothetical protein
MTALQSVGLRLAKNYVKKDGRRCRCDDDAKGATRQARRTDEAETSLQETREAPCEARMLRFLRVASLQTLCEDTMNGAMKTCEQETGDRYRDRSAGLPGDAMGEIDCQVAGTVNLLSCPHANAIRSRNTNARESKPTG